MQPRNPPPPDEAAIDASQPSGNPGASRPGGSRRDQELDRELDEELDATFPASDPLPWSHEVN